MNTTSKLLTFSAIAALGSSSTFLSLSEKTNGSLPSGINVVDGSFPYGCGELSFLSPDYIFVKPQNLELVCSKIEEGKTYLLEGGQAIQKTNGACHIAKNFTGVADQLLCGSWNVGTVNIVDATTCPEKSTLLSEVDVSNQLLNEICPRIGKNWNLVTRKGYLKNYGMSMDLCILDYWADTGVPQKLACVSPTFETIKTTEPASEKLCGENQSLVTLEEFKQSKDAICSFLERKAAGRRHLDVRLAGGSYVWVKRQPFSDEWGCAVETKTSEPLEHGLCADVKRKSL